MSSIGDRSRRSARRLWAKIPLAYRQHATFFTDQYVIYEGVMPAAQHRAISKLARKTHHIERFNNTLRQPDESCGIEPAFHGHLYRHVYYETHRRDSAHHAAGFYTATNRNKLSDPISPHTSVGCQPQHVDLPNWFTRGILTSGISFFSP